MTQLLNLEKLDVGVPNLKEEISHFLDVVHFGFEGGLRRGGVEIHRHFAEFHDVRLHLPALDRRAHAHKHRAAAAFRTFDRLNGVHETVGNGNDLVFDRVLVLRDRLRIDDLPDDEDDRVARRVLDRALLGQPASADFDDLRVAVLGDDLRLVVDRRGKRHGGGAQKEHRRKTFSEYRIFLHDFYRLGLKNSMGVLSA